MNAKSAVTELDKLLHFFFTCLKFTGIIRAYPQLLVEAEARGLIDMTGTIVH